jgi:hypothetical protein
MTKADKPTRRMSYSMVRGREIVVTIHPTWLGFRLKGQRKEFQMDIEAAYQRAALAEAEKLRAEKRALRLANKASGRKRRA